MGAPENKRLMQKVFDELARGNRAPFGEAMAEDIHWTIIGTGAWSGTWKGIESVRSDLFGPLFAQFETTYRNTAIRLLAEDDWVVIESRGDVTTKAGKPYRNAYCYVCRLEDGKLNEVTEYCDTELIAEALAPPPAGVPA
jgi:ketosteroid isomerase-like protein